MAWTTSSTHTLVSPVEHSLFTTRLSGSLFRIATNVFAYVLQRFFVARLNPHGRACSTALSESLLVSYRPLALELSSSRARRNPLVLCLAGIQEIRGLPGYAKYYRVFWKTRSRRRRAADSRKCPAATFMDGSYALPKWTQNLNPRVSATLPRCTMTPLFYSQSTDLPVLRGRRCVDGAPERPQTGVL